MGGLKEAERELEKIEEVLAMADRMIQLSRQEQERLAAGLLVDIPERAELSTPPVKKVT